MYNILRTLGLLSLIWISLVFLTAGSANAAGKPARTDTVAAGTYIINVNLSKDPPYVDEAFDVTIVPRNSALKLSGKVIMRPGSGTNGTDLPTTLQAVRDGQGSLRANVHIPVQGAWNIVVQLDGPQGPGQASIPVTVGAPGAMQPWLAWLIGASPLVFIAIWIATQHRYRRSLLTPKTAEAAEAAG
ncbi:hypothetical protein [Dictyobacter kobayashii]|uniref:YtkA-like domain-containing protein n=1 Tax=Dictyobacter kobayashii TaxID=2014872 RepID=A0A402ALN6_9CHLR|nr:hypothetical protein [Dictyobacter kobayashii]GCE19949.1 hypothetical protein KDK_37490 [Dictyobacter kobayashii]